MSKRIRDHIRSNVIGYLALFVALSGTAYAVDGPLPGQNQVGSEDIINNDLRSADVRDDTAASGGLQAVDLRPDSVGSSEVADDSLGALDLTPDSVTSSETAADSVGTSEVANGSLTRDDIAESSLFAINRSITPDCDPTTSTFAVCGGVSLNLAVQSDVLVIANAIFGGHGVGRDEGICRLTRGALNISVFSEPIDIGQEGNEHAIAFGDGFSRSGVDLDVPPGLTTWNLRCNQTDGDLRIADLQFVAIGIAN